MSNETPHRSQSLLRFQGLARFDGEQLDDQSLPDWMQTKEMKQAMNTLSTFLEKQQQYDRYQARQEYLRIQNSIQMELEQERKEKEEALLREEAAKQREVLAVQENKVALEEIERLKALLKQQADGKQ